MRSNENGILLKTRSNEVAVKKQYDPVGTHYRTCYDCDHDFKTMEFSDLCPKCNGDTKSTPLFKNKAQWEELMRWQG